MHAATKLMRLSRGSAQRQRVGAATAAASSSVVASRKGFSTDVATQIRIAVIGTGPSAFYFSKYILKENAQVSVDLIDRLPTPFGLVRFGVAPDHPEVKSVTDDFEAVMKESSSRIRFFGNCEVGKDVSVEDLSKSYDAIVFAYGAQGDRMLGLKGEEALQKKMQVLGARDFVGWYNGHPDFKDLNPSLEKYKAVVVVGHGNVALDCARVLLKNVPELSKTDIAQHAVDKLRKSSIKRVSVVGRRGHPQASFTMKELRELTKLDQVGCVVHAEELDGAMTDASKKEIESQRATKRMNQLLRESSVKAKDAEKQPRQVDLRFLSNPMELIVNKNNDLVGLKIEKTKLQGDAGNQKAVGTGEFEIIPCDLLLRSIGYKSEPLQESMLKQGIFDSKRSVMKNVSGKVRDGMYCTGWLKRGPSGIIGTNIVDAKETVETVKHDIKLGIIKGRPVSSAKSPLEKLANVVSWNGWKVIDREECSRGAKNNKIREKMIDVDEMVQLATKSS